MGRWCGLELGLARRCVKCEECAWYTCLRCEESFSTGDVAGAEVAIEHECDSRKDGELEERAFKGLTQGREWQICPNEECKRRVELSDGCNHVRCVCRTHFCFLCGKVVRDGEGHWRRDGGCPRFGQKESERAIYDEHDIWNDNDDVRDEERAWGVQRAEDGEEEALRRAFELQMQMVADMRMELEEAEAARLRNRARQDDGVALGADSGLQRRNAQRRRRPREDRGVDDEQRRDPYVDRRRADAQQFAASESFNGRRPRGFRAFIGNAIEMLLFGRPLPHRR